MSNPVLSRSANRPETTPDLHRAGWFLVAAFGSFALGVATMSVNVDRFDAEQDAADRLDIGIHELPGDTLAPIAQKHSSMGMELAVMAPTIVAFLLFIAGVWLATRGARRVGGIARIAATIAAAAWIACMAVFLTLFAGPETLTWVRDNFVDLVKTTTAISVIAGSAAVIALALHLRSREVARRTGLAVMGVAAVAAVLAPVPAVGGMPPAMSCLLAMVLGIVMIRSPKSS